MRWMIRAALLITFSIATALVFIPASFAAPQSSNTPSSGLQGVGQQAIDVVLRENVIDPTALVQPTNKHLPTNGKWSVGKERPAQCPQTTDACVLILYQVPEDSVSCQWVVQLVGDGSDGFILQQNQDATHYLLRRLPPSQVADLVLKKKQPSYPPIAQAAHVSGTVVLRVIVSVSGTPEETFVVSGPEMLRASAADAIIQWTFKPLLTGTQPVRFIADISFDYRTSGPGSSQITSKP